MEQFNFRYLRGASYTGDRYLEAMKVVTTNTDNFTARGFVINSGHDATKNQQGLDIYGTYTSGATNYLQFRGFTDSVATTIQLKFYYDAVGKSLANSSGTPVSSSQWDVKQLEKDYLVRGESYNLLTPKISKLRNSYTFYYKDVVSFTVTPSFGYRVVGLVAASGTNLLGKKAFVSENTSETLGVYTGSFEYNYSQKYFGWIFDKVEYALVFINSNSSPSDIVRMQILLKPMYTKNLKDRFKLIIQLHKLLMTMPRSLLCREAMSKLPMIVMFILKMLHGDIHTQ